MGLSCYLRVVLPVNYIDDPLNCDLMINNDYWYGKWTIKPMKLKFCWHKGFPLKWRTDVSTYFCPHCDIVCPAPCWTCRCKQAAAAWMNTSADRLNIQQDILLFMTLYGLITLVTTSLTSCRSYVLCRTVDCIFSHVHGCRMLRTHLSILLLYFLLQKHVHDEEEKHFRE